MRLGSALSWALCAVPAVMLACGGGGTSSTTQGTGAGGGTSSGSGGMSAGGTGGTGGAGGAEGESVLQRNKHASRDGHFVQPSLTAAAVATMHRDPSFNGVVQGNVYAAPLYVEDGPGGQGAFYVVTESDNVYALSEADGSTLWTASMGTAAGKTGAGCGDVLPVGITGTPYIDLPSRTIYLDAAIGDANTIQTHLVHALSIDDGTERAGFPVDVSTVTFDGLTLNPVLQNQRGALIVVNGTLYVPYGGHAGDCGQYRGWVVGIPVASPGAAKGFATAAPGGGMWAPGGLASDGKDVFVASGNTFGATTWSQGDAILRLQPGPVFSGKTADYFVPSNWQALDAGDIDLGGSGPLLVDVPGATPSKLVVALGKNGVAYLLDRQNLGGIGMGDGTTGEGVASAQVGNGTIITVASAFPALGGAIVVMRAAKGGSDCPSGQSGELVAVKIDAASPPKLSTLWCAPANGKGAPIVTTTDGQSSPIVWIAGAEQTERLYAFDGISGAPLFAGGGAADQMPTQVRRFTSPIAVKGRIVVAADGGVYAFKP